MVRLKFFAGTTKTNFGNRGKNNQSLFPAETSTAGKYDLVSV